MTTSDLQAVDELCRLAVAARRCGCSVHLSGADPRLRELIDLAGVDDVLVSCPAEFAGQGAEPGVLR
jgi:ABC-type transporter Mla MlaB component